MKYLAIIILLAAAWWLVGQHQVPQAFGSQPASQIGDAVRASSCQEDNPCWRWSTMGNRRRGIATYSIGRVVVRKSGFCAARRAKDINWKRTPHLKGDPTC